MAKKKRKSGARLLFGIIKLGVVLFAAAFLALLGYQLLSEHLVPFESDSSAPLVVLGAQVNQSGEPSVQLQWRLEKALEVYQFAPRAIVVCGARGKDEPRAEAEVMRDWLLARGVDEKHILVDDKSVNTRQNLRNALALLPAGTKKIIIITSDYHLPRAMQLAKDMGMETGGIGSPIKPEYWLKNHARETLAWGKYFLGKVLPVFAR